MPLHWIDNAMPCLSKLWTLPARVYTILLLDSILARQVMQRSHDINMILIKFMPLLVSGPWSVVRIFYLPPNKYYSTLRMPRRPYKRSICRQFSSFVYCSCVDYCILEDLNLRFLYLQVHGLLCVEHRIQPLFGDHNSLIQADELTRVVTDCKSQLSV